MSAKQIKIKDKTNLHIIWNDGSESSISLRYLRDECPCAVCKGETVLLKTYKPAAKDPISESGYKIAAIDQVGNYAVQIAWKDGHNTGIYNWDYLKKLSNDESSGAKQDYNKLL
jgi:DUF971 family protein